MHFTESKSDETAWRALPAAPVRDWPEFALKLRPLDRGSARAVSGEAVRRLGWLTAELLGGGHEETVDDPDWSAGTRAAHLPSAPEAVRRLVDQAIIAPDSFGSGSEYVAALVAVR